MAKLVSTAELLIVYFTVELLDSKTSTTTSTRFSQY